MKNLKTKLTLVFLAFLAFSQEAIATTSDARTRLGNAVPESLKTGASSDLPSLVGVMVTSIIGFIGVIMIVLVIWAGFTWGTAGGDTAKVKRAKEIMINAVIGLILVMVSYGITTLVLSLVGITE